MKLKLLLFILLLPFVSFGASTNKVDNLWVPSSARFSFGLPGVGKVLTSDAVGFSSWSLPSAGFDPSTNWTSGGHATFSSGLTSTNYQANGSNNLFYSMRVISNLFIGPASTGKFTYEANGDRIVSDSMWVRTSPTGGGQILIGPGTSYLEASAAGILNIYHASGQVGRLAGAGGTMANWFVDGNLTVTNNTVLGTGSANTMTINGVSIAMPNGLNFGSGNLVLPASSAGTSTNGYANAYFTGGIIATNAAGITQIDELIFVGQGIISNRTTGATLQIR